MFSSGNEFSGQLFVRCSPIALAPPPSTPLLTKLYIFRPTWINLEAEINVWKYRSKLTTKYEISCWRNMVAHQYKLAWKEETFVNLVPINERHKIAFKNTFSWLVWLQECEENMGIQQMLSSWEKKNLNEHLASDIVDRFPNITKMCKNEIKRNVPIAFRLHEAVLESKCTLLESCSQGDKAVDNFE